jgi:hypothetical protein
MFRVITFLSFLLFSFEVLAQDISYVPETESQALSQGLTVDDPIVREVGLGFAEAVRKENSSWYECGKTTPKEEYDSRGLRIALAMRIALLEVGLKDPIYLWGAAGIIYQESRGNPCVTGPRSRVWARENNVLGDVHWTRFTEQDIFKIVRSKAFKNRRTGIDSGIAQTIFPRNTSIYDTATRSVRKATIEEMVTVEGSARAAAFHMLEKAVESPKYPWAFWPGGMDKKYAGVIAYQVRRMGGPHQEMVPKCKKTN